ncbi:uncharacterized protein METZ01_LOCUS371156, partial [marine metagenome]
FALLWLLCHQSRFKEGGGLGCWLERWSEEAEEQGAQALERLRDGVQKSIETLGAGFLSNTENKSLIHDLQSGELTEHEFYGQILRLVYRLIFLCVAEDRDLLHPDGTSQNSKTNYSNYFSLKHLRELAQNVRGSSHSDLWESQRLVQNQLSVEKGGPELGLPALGGIFGNERTTDIINSRLSNLHFLKALRSLCFVQETYGRRPVDFRNLGSEELGSVYEALLELHPEMDRVAGTYSLDAYVGNARKTSGSYYTPTSLIQELLNSALDPVVENSLKGKKNEEAEETLLNLKVCDPACGSGHFLV